MIREKNSGQSALHCIVTATLHRQTEFQRAQSMEGKGRVAATSGTVALLFSFG